MIRNNPDCRRQGRLAMLCGMTLCGVTVLGAMAPATLRADEPATALSPAASAPTEIPLPSRPPKGAIVLFSGSANDLRNNWLKRYTTEPADWSADKGLATPKRSDIVTKQEFGDCYLHVEFRPQTDKDGKIVGHGNSGVGFQGRYEVQILGDYGKEPESHGSAALYSQKAPMRNASRKPGEWQSYDIIFRGPRFDASGQVTEKPRATVFQNGILVQNNEEFTGMTGIQYQQYKEMAKTGPILLQGDHDVVQFRNIWVVPL